MIANTMKLMLLVFTLPVVFAIDDLAIISGSVEPSKVTTKLDEISTRIQSCLSILSNGVGEPCKDYLKKANVSEFFKLSF